MEFEYVLVFIISLIFYYVVGMLHELSHIVFCKILKCKITKYKIGFIKFEDNKIKIAFKGDNFCNFKTDDSKKALLILCAGPIVNFVVLIASIILTIFTKDFVRVFFILSIIFSALSLFLDLCPIIDNDGRAIIRIIKDRRKNG